MGKAQSKRSVDITTETKKGSEDEITEKMEKIEDLDKKDINGDATIHENSETERKGTDVIENDKDLTTEKDSDVQVCADLVETAFGATPTKEEGDLATVEVISPLADEGVKKSKKEKVKKKWSFRNLSFGKKDKQKPARNEETAEDCTMATNEVDDEAKSLTDFQGLQKDKSVNETEGKMAESRENGEASHQELNGRGQDREAMSEEKSKAITGNCNKNTVNTNGTSVSVENEAVAVSSKISEKTDNKSVITSIIKDTKAFENNIDDVSKHGNGIAEEINTTVQEDVQKTDTSVEVPTEKTCTLDDLTNETSSSTNGEIIYKIHQNGDSAEPDHEIIEQSKAQIEVKSNTDKVSADSLNSIPSTPNYPSNTRVHIQYLNTSCEKPDEIIQVSNNDPIDNSTVFEVENPANIPHSLNETVSIIKKDNVRTEKITSVSIETGGTKNSPSLKEFGNEPSPPPLPISPPPSQVTVFAFTSIGETVDNSIQIKNSEQTIATSIKEKYTEITPPPSNEIFDISQVNTIEEEVELKKSVVETIYNETKVAKANNDGEFKCENIELNICREEQNNDLLSNRNFDELHETEISVAVAIMDEITEKAAEMLNEQLSRSDAQLAQGQTLQSDKLSTVENKCYNKEISSGMAFVEIDSIESTIQNKIEGGNIKYNRCLSQISNTSENFTVVDVNDTCIASPLKLSTPDSMHLAQEEVIPLIKSDNFEEEYLNSSKDFSNAIDLKENVVAEASMDLSVTCE